MNWIKKLFSKKEEKQCAISVVSSSLSFKEKMQQDIIPKVWQMAEKEKEHLNWLIDNNASKEMIEASRNYLSHFRKRHKEYIDYVAEAINENSGLHLQRVNNSALPKLPEFAASNFDNVAEIAQRLTTGNVSHHARTIEGLAKRNAEFIRKHYC